MSTFQAYAMDSNQYTAQSECQVYEAQGTCSTVLVTDKCWS